MIDVALVLMAAPVIVPMLVAVAVLVKITSPGPIIFRHRRIGRHGAPFSMWKFRTMYEDSSHVLDLHLAEDARARAEWRSTHKLRDDPRVTAIGSFLRRHSFDELPQVWNVLRGEMSLIGPRPIVAAEARRYGDRWACYCSVKPGITGLWQVSGRSKRTYEERIALDCEYVHCWSLAGDAKILGRTFSAVARQDGAF